MDKRVLDLKVRLFKEKEDPFCMLCHYKVLIVSRDGKMPYLEYEFRLIKTKEWTNEMLNGRIRSAMRKIKVPYVLINPI